ncbi:MAG: cytidine deaminase [Panacibacter sp.]
MKELQAGFIYEEYESINELNATDAMLMNKARAVTKYAYAPYSHFNVGATALLKNGSFINGTNQENASYPIGICAERVLLSSASSQFPGEAIEAIAISYYNENGTSDQPVSPCGICRQTLVEYEERQEGSIRLILGGQEGKILIIPKSSMLLPLGFGSEDLKLHLP